MKGWRAVSSLLVQPQPGLFAAADRRSGIFFMRIPHLQLLGRRPQKRHSLAGMQMRGWLAAYLHLCGGVGGWVTLSDLVIYAKEGLMKQIWMREQISFTNFSWTSCLCCHHGFASVTLIQSDKRLISHWLDDISLDAVILLYIFLAALVAKVNCICHSS